jgi:hypothetical protein
LAAHKAALRGLFTDEEFRNIASILRVSPLEEGIRENIGISILLALARRPPVSALLGRKQLERIRSAASELHDALEATVISGSVAQVLLAFALHPPRIIGEIEEGINHAKEHTAAKAEATEGFSLTFRELIRHCEMLRDLASKAIAGCSDPMRGRPSDRQRDDVVRSTADIYRHYRRREATLTTRPPVEDRTTYGGEFYEFASIMDRAFLRAAGRNPDHASRIGSVLKRFRTKRSREGKKTSVTRP